MLRPLLAVRNGALSGSGAIQVVALAAGFVFFLAGFGKPYSSDEFWFLAKACEYPSAVFFNREIVIHPPFYTLLTAWLMALFSSPLAARLTGLACCAGAVLLLVKAGGAAGGGRRALTAAALLAISPAFIRAALILDIDNTLITLAAAAMALAVVKRRPALLAPLFFFALWSKLTACVPLAAVFLLHAGWEDRLDGGSRLRATASALVAAAAAWAASFFLFCEWKNLPFGDPFRYMFFAAGTKTLSPAGASAQALQAALWAGPPLCVLALIGLKSPFLRGASPLDRLSLLIVAVIGAGHLFVGGTPFGFPKFQIPALPFLCWLAAGTIARAPGISLFAAAAAGLATLAGDPLYTLRFSMREAAALASAVDLQSAIAPCVLKLAAQILLPFLPAAAAVLVFRRRLGLRGAAAAGLAAAFAGQAVAMNLMQVRGYNSAYNYGATGLDGAARAARAALEGGGKAMLPLEVYGTLRVSGIRLDKTADAAWRDERIVEAISSGEYRVLVYGIASNTVEQVRFLRGPVAVALLRSGGWRPDRSGAYEIWSR